jgi:hypothetical protein
MDRRWFRPKTRNQLRRSVALSVVVGKDWPMYAGWGPGSRRFGSIKYV